jgi:hypothetical protein
MQGRSSQDVQAVISDRAKLSDEQRDWTFTTGVSI